MKVCKFCALIGCHCTKSLHKMCKTSWWQKIYCFVRDFEPKLKKHCSIESWFFSYEETYYESKKAKKVYVTVLLFILYSVWVHVENPNKMICLKSQKSSDFFF